MEEREKCSHEVIFHGLCAVCGLDVSALVELVEASQSQRSQTHPLAHSRSQSRTSSLQDGVQYVNGGSAAAVTGGSGVASSTTRTSADVARSTNIKSTQAVVHGSAAHTIYLSEAAFAEKARTTMKSLYDAKKLVMVLDLDHTLVHASIDPSLTPHYDGITKLPTFAAYSFHFFYLPMFAPPHPNFPVSAIPQQPHFISIRPHMSTFLQSLSSLYEFHVFTMGSRPYANMVVSHLDPTGKMFKKRVVSRSEANGWKELRRLCLAEESMISILDDRIDIWPSTVYDNVVKIHPYVYWNAKEVYNRLETRPGVVNGNSPNVKPPQITSKPSNSSETSSIVDLTQSVENGSSEKIITTPNEPESPCNQFVYSAHFDPNKMDNVLLSLRNVFITAHTLFFAQFSESRHFELPLAQTLSLPHLLYLIRKSTFHNCHFLFSGIIPLDQPPETHDLWRVSSAFGAKCYSQMDDQGKGIVVDRNAKKRVRDSSPPAVDEVKNAGTTITHIIAANGSTAKVRHAQKYHPSINIVHFSWLLNSVAHYSRAKEADFGIGVDFAHDSKVKKAYVNSVLVQYSEHIVTVDEIIARVHAYQHDPSQSETKENDLPSENAEGEQQSEAITSVKRHRLNDDSTSADDYSETSSHLLALKNLVANQLPSTSDDIMGQELEDFLQSSI